MKQSWVRHFSWLMPFLSLIDIPSMWLWPAYLSCCNVHLLRNWRVIIKPKTRRITVRAFKSLFHYCFWGCRANMSEIINNTKLGWPFFAPHNGISVPFLVVPRGCCLEKSSFQPRKMGQNFTPNPICWLLPWQYRNTSAVMKDRARSHHFYDTADARK